VAAGVLLIGSLALAAEVAAADRDRLVFHAESASGEAVASHRRLPSTRLRSRYDPTVGTEIFSRTML
jgi:hypothetical protein